MCAVRLDLTAADLPDSLAGVRSEIEQAVPHGRTNHGQPGDEGAWTEAPSDIAALADKKMPTLRRLCEQHPKMFKHDPHHQTYNHLGTLGTGNHFIEVCLDEANRVWVMLHSGSRGVGNRIGSYFIEVAKRDMRKWFVNLPDENLAYLPDGTDHFKDYVVAVTWAQEYAALNRRVMLDRVIGAVGIALGRDAVSTSDEAVNCHHNYVEKEHHFGANVWLTRKGAVRARNGDLGIIPGSMGVRSYIVRGKGNAEAFHSCSHGAGPKDEPGRGQAHVHD